MSREDLATKFKNPDDQFKLVCDLAKSEYDRVFWIVDLDNIIKESNETPPGARSSLAYFSELKTNLSNAFPNVQTIVNNPCLEFWFLLHFIKTSKSYRRCSDVSRVLKVHLKGYEKNEKFFKKRDNDIYLKLKPYLPQAIENARVLGPFESEYPFKAKCEMNDLFKYTELQCCLNTDASLG